LLPLLLLLLLKPALTIFRLFALLSLTLPLSCQSFCLLPLLDSAPILCTLLFGSHPSSFFLCSS
jgi:hypothetical protein